MHARICGKQRGMFHGHNQENIRRAVIVFYLHPLTDTICVAMLLHRALHHVHKSSSTLHISQICGTGDSYTVLAQWNRRKQNQNKLGAKRWLQCAAYDVCACVRACACVRVSGRTMMVVTTYVALTLSCWYEALTVSWCLITCSPCVSFHSPTFTKHTRTHARTHAHAHT